MYEDRYQMLVESMRRGADLAPVDFDFMKWWEEARREYLSAEQQQA